MALPTSVFPNPALAPKPSSFADVLEPFPAIRIAALSFETPQLATDIYNTALRAASCRKF